MDNTNLENLTKQQFDELIKGEDLVLLEFYGTWCMPCKMVTKILDRIKEERSDFKLVMLDIDKNMNLAKEFAVLTVPSFLILKNGVQVEKMVGFRQYNQINDALNKHKNND